jgi:putative MATE family efflux protein
MKDFTKDSITRHILTMAVPVAIGMLTQMAYQLIDLYFIAQIGEAAIAGVALTGNVMLIIVALTQVLGVSTVALVAQAVGRKDPEDANLVFNQSLIMSIVCAVMTLAGMAVLLPTYFHSVAADEATTENGMTFALWVMPCFALLFPMTAVGAALRGTGIVKPTIIVQMLTVVINALLAPILIAGWITGTPLGVKGAALATSISIVIGVILLGVYFYRSKHYIAAVPALMRPQYRQWGRMLKIGLPAGGEFALQFAFTAVAYYAIRSFGASAQAGFGIGSRVLHAILLPAMAIAFAAGPIVGQNFGANNGERVRDTFRKAALIGTAAMIGITLFAQWRPHLFVSVFAADVASIAVAALFLQIISWNFVAQGLVYTCTNIFQGLGNTVPPLISSGICLLVFAIPAVSISSLPDFRIEHVWYLFVASATLHALLSLWLLRVEFRKKLLPILSALN